jgi:phage shock protein PspC (stress-responsive transcriptional regulator)
MFEELDTASTDLGINAQVSPHLINIARLFQIFFGGIIVVLTVGIILTLAIPGSPYDQYRYPPSGGGYL